jgi:hypothetical protein
MERKAEGKQKEGKQERGGEKVEGNVKIHKDHEGKRKLIKIKH